MDDGGSIIFVNNYNAFVLVDYVIWLLMSRSACYFYKHNFADQNFL
jgi:hypothetical protein